MVPLEVLTHNIKIHLRSPEPFGPSPIGLSFEKVCLALSHNIHMNLLGPSPPGLEPISDFGSWPDILQGMHAL